ncbi:hypothetical protein LDENG_00240820 [Lucifuga dentata]|nr:hypothetical protein LDENG_00240820 [Lucifuga dentata]
MCNYLQNPRHVARFQRLCGVKGTFPDKPSQEDSGLLASCEPRQRQQKHGDSPDVNVGNGAARHATVPQDNGIQDDTGSPLRPDTARAKPLRPDTARAKPLRKNSLTGDVGQEFLINNKLLFYLFTFGTELGNEMFFIVFFPFLFWNVDALVSRRLIVVWAWNLFVGQSTKDVVRWSRPASPPVVKVEVFYNSEYSMPSTHAMTGTAIPFCLFMLSYGRWQVCTFCTKNVQYSIKLRIICTYLVWLESKTQILSTHS